MSNFQLIATSAFGLETVVARELSTLGMQNIHSQNGYVEFTGDERDIVRANLWLRSADRVLIKMGQFRADTFDALFEQTKALTWAEWLPSDANIPVTGRSVQSTLASVPACQSIVKKAIIESLKHRHSLEIFPESGATFSVDIALHKDVALLTLDTSGAGLHRRGYRTLNVIAPIRETLAAALVQLSWWKPHRPFADPMCGSGTIAIEAALFARNIAPGLRREFASEAWNWIGRTAWDEGRDEAHAAIRRDLEVDIFAGDMDEEALKLARFHAAQAGVVDDLIFARQDVGLFRPQQPYGCIVTNPPYGERLGEREEVDQLYAKMGKTFSRLDTWSVFVISSHPTFEKQYGKRADKKRKLYNGRIQTNVFQYLGPLPPGKPKAEAQQ